MEDKIDKLSVGKLPPKLDKLVSNLIRLDRKRQKSEMLKRLPKKKVAFLDSPNLSLKKYMDGFNDCRDFVEKKLKEK